MRHLISLAGLDFIFTVLPVLQVYSQCKLSGTSAGQVVGVTTLGAWEVCTSPQVGPGLMQGLDCHR